MLAQLIQWLTRRREGAKGTDQKQKGSLAPCRLGDPALTLRAFAPSRDSCDALIEQVERTGAVGISAIATCPVCGQRTHSTILDEWTDGAMLVEAFACFHCHALIVSEDAGEGRQPTVDELRRFSRAWPVLWADMERGQKFWRAKQRGLTIGGSNQCP
jgi:hypothetical protein